MISLADRPYVPSPAERKRGSVFYQMGFNGETLTPEGRSNDYFCYLYECGIQAKERENQEPEPSGHEILYYGDLPTCKKCGRCGDWLTENDCEGD